MYPHNVVLSWKSGYSGYSGFCTIGNESNVIWVISFLCMYPLNKVLYWKSGYSGDLTFNRKWISKL